MRLAQATVGIMLPSWLDWKPIRELDDDAVAAQNGIGGDTVRRYIRLTNLIPSLLDMVFKRKSAFNPAVEFSYLTPEQQSQLIDAME